MTIASWTTAQLKMSVEVNSTYLPFKETPDLMQRFVRPALFRTGDEVYELQVFGTALMARYRGWDFALATAHQVAPTREAPRPEKFVAIIKSDGRRLAVPPSSIHHPKIDEEEYQSLRDLTFFGYDQVPAELRSPHLDLSNLRWSDSTDVAVDYSFVIGYPSDSMRIEPDPEDETRLAEFTACWIRQDLQAAKPAPMDTEHRSMFVKHERSTRLSIDPNGLSGSPVFSIVHDQRDERSLKFEGIVTNAREDRFAVFPSVYIRQMLDGIVDERRRSPQIELPSAANPC